MKKAQLCKTSLGWTFSIFGGVTTFVIAVLGQLSGYVSGNVGDQFLRIMEISNPFYIFDLSVWWGGLLGTLEAFVFWFLLGWVFAWLYNKMIS